MRMQQVLSLLQVVPIAASLIGATAFSGYAAEASLLMESDPSTTATELSPTESVSKSISELISESISAEPKLAEISSLPDLQSAQRGTGLFSADDAIAAVSQSVTQTEANFAAAYQWQISSRVVLNTVPPIVDDKATYANGNGAVTSRVTSSMMLTPSGSEPELEQSTSTLAKDLGQAQFTPSTASAETGDPAITVSTGEAQFIPIAQADLAQMTSEDWSIAQAEPAFEAETSQTRSEAEDSSVSPRWRFSLSPYAFVPVSVDGRVTVRDFRTDFDLGLDDVLDPLNFALAGRLEAWREHLGLIFDAAYFDLGQDRSSDLSLPNCLCNVLPSRIDTEINVQYGQFDLGVGYRYGENLSSAKTEFEMGELVFDAIIGVRLYTFDQEINISTNLANDRNLQSSTTILTPLASGRIRWNLSPTLAGWVRGDIAGFGIGGTLLATSLTAGVDWLFAGDTSLLLAYRLSTLQYTTDVQGEELGLNLLLHGPYLGMVFRF